MAVWICILKYASRKETALHVSLYVSSLTLLRRYCTRAFDIIYMLSLILYGLITEFSNNVKLAITHPRCLARCNMFTSLKVEKQSDLTHVSSFPITHAYSPKEFALRPSPSNTRCVACNLSSSGRCVRDKACVC